jgi:hypothetical protein
VLPRAMCNISQVENIRGSVGCSIVVSICIYKYTAKLTNDNAWVHSYRSQNQTTIENTNALLGSGDTQSESREDVAGSIPAELSSIAVEGNRLCGCLTCGV